MYVNMLKPLSHCHEVTHDMRRVSASYNSSHIATMSTSCFTIVLVKIVLRDPHDMLTIFKAK